MQSPLRAHQVRLATLKALCSWAARCHGLPPSVVTRMAEGLAEKRDSLRAAHLRVLAQLLRSQPEAARGAAELASPLLKLLTDALSKPALRGDGVVALLVLSQIASADPWARTAIHANKVRFGAQTSVLLLALSIDGRKYVVCRGNAAKHAMLVVTTPMQAGMRLLAPSLIACLRLYFRKATRAGMVCGSRSGVAAAGRGGARQAAAAGCGAGARACRVAVAAARRRAESGRDGGGGAGRGGQLPALVQGRASCREGSAYTLCHLRAYQHRRVLSARRTLGCRSHV